MCVVCSATSLARFVAQQDSLVTTRMQTSIRIPAPGFGTGDMP